jgi:hypothetical protein
MAAPAVVSAGALTVLTSVSLVLLLVAVALATLHTLYIYSAVELILNQYLLIVAAICIGSLLGPVVPAALHMCTRAARCRGAEGSVIALSFLPCRLTVFFFALASLVPRFARSHEIVCWIPVALCCFVVARLSVSLRATRRIHAQHIAHESGAFARTLMNRDSKPAAHDNAALAFMKGELILKQWAFGYMCRVLEKWKVRRSHCSNLYEFISRVLAVVHRSHLPVCLFIFIIHVWSPPSGIHRDSAQEEKVHIVSAGATPRQSNHR